MKKLINNIRYNYYCVLTLAFLIYRRIPRAREFAVKKVGEKGEGLFAKRSYKRGDLVFIANGSINFATFNGEECYQYPDWYMVDQGTWIDIQYPYVKTNHSCKPNLGIRFGRCFVALCNISIDEELNFDYSLTDDEKEWVMNKSKCLCEEKNCRIWVSSIYDVPYEQFNYTYPYISKYFIDIYKNSQNQK